MSLFACLFSWRWCHRLGWPIHHVQTCSDCGKRFISPLFGMTEEDARKWQNARLDQGGLE